MVVFVISKRKSVDTKPIVALEPSEISANEQTVEPTVPVDEPAPEAEPSSSPDAAPAPSPDSNGVIGDDGYEWITFPPQSQNHFYRVPGTTDWSKWDG